MNLDYSTSMLPIKSYIFFFCALYRPGRQWVVEQLSSQPSDWSSLEAYGSLRLRRGLSYVKELDKAACSEKPKRKKTQWSKEPRIFGVSFLDQLFFSSCLWIKAYFHLIQEELKKGFFRDTFENEFDCCNANWNLMLILTLWLTLCRASHSTNLINAWLSSDERDQPRGRITAIPFQERELWSAQRRGQTRGKRTERDFPGHLYKLCSCGVSQKSICIYDWSEKP